MKMRVLFLLMAFMAPASCGKFQLPQRPAASVPDGEGPMRPVARPSGLDTTAAPAPPSTARTAAQFDTVSPEEKQAAEAAAAEAAVNGEGASLGETVASLGDPAQPGLWLKTPLVSAPQRGRVVYGKTGKAVELDLMPLEGPKTGGSRISLAALRVIEAPLTDLVQLEVFSN